MANAKNNATKPATKTNATKTTRGKRANLDSATKTVLAGGTNAKAIGETVPSAKPKTKRQTKTEDGPTVNRVPVDLGHIMRTVKLTDLFAAMTEDQSRQAERFFLNRKKARTASESEGRATFVPQHPARSVLTGTVQALRDYVFAIVGKDDSVHSNVAIARAIDSLPYIAVPDSVDSSFVHVEPTIAGLKRACARVVTLVAEETKLQKTGRIS